MMTATGSYDTLPSNGGRGATTGPPGCPVQSPPVPFRWRRRVGLQGLSASWGDWRRQKVFLIRKRSQVRVLDRPLAGIQEFAAFTQFSGIWLAGGSAWSGCSMGPQWGHRRLPVRRKSAPGFAPPSGGRRLREPGPPCAEGTGRRALGSQVKSPHQSASGRAWSIAAWGPTATLPVDARPDRAALVRTSGQPRLRWTLSDHSRAVATGTPHVRFGCQCRRISQRHRSHAATAD